MHRRMECNKDRSDLMDHNLIWNKGCVDRTLTCILFKRKTKKSFISVDLTEKSYELSCLSWQILLQDPKPPGEL